MVRFSSSMYNLNICINSFRLSFYRYFSCRLVFRWPGADTGALWEPAGFRYSDQSRGRRSGSERLQQTTSHCWHTTGAAEPGQHTGKGQMDLLTSQQSTHKQFYSIVSFTCEFHFFCSWSRLMVSTLVWRKSSLRAEKTPPNSLSSTSSYWSNSIRRQSWGVNSSWNSTRQRVSTVASFAPLHLAHAAKLQ